MGGAALWAGDGGEVWGVEDRGEGVVADGDVGAVEEWEGGVEGVSESVLACWGEIRVISICYNLVIDIYNISRLQLYTRTYKPH